MIRRMLRIMLRELAELGLLVLLIFLILAGTTGLALLLMGG